MTTRRTTGAQGAPTEKKMSTGKAPTHLRAPKETWELRLYVAGKTPRSIEAFGNLKRICEDYLKGRYQIEVIDLLENPTLARGDQILAVPALVRKLPPPVKKIIGDFSNTERVLVGLNLRPLKRAPSRRISQKPSARGR